MIILPPPVNSETFYAFQRFEHAKAAEIEAKRSIVNCDNEEDKKFFNDVFLTLLTAQSHDLAHAKNLSELLSLLPKKLYRCDFEEFKKEYKSLVGKTNPDYIALIASNNLEKSREEVVKILEKSHEGGKKNMEQPMKNQTPTQRSLR